MTHWPPFRWNPVTGFNVLTRRSRANLIRYGSLKIAERVREDIRKERSRRGIL